MLDPEMEKQIREIVRQELKDVVRKELKEIVKGEIPEMHDQKLVFLETRAAVRDSVLKFVENLKQFFVIPITVVRVIVAAVGGTNIWKAGEVLI